MTKQPLAAQTGLRPGFLAGLAALIPQLTAICGPGSVITDPLELRTYECDGLTAHRCSPGLVVLPQPPAQVAGIVRACVSALNPFVARGRRASPAPGRDPQAGDVLILRTR